MKIVPLNRKDLPFAHELTRIEKWGTSFSELEDLWNTHGEGAFLGTIDNLPVGMVFATAYNTKGFIGELIIKHDHRGKGYGTLMMQHAIDYLESKKISNILLDAVPQAVPLYNQFGFHEICKSWRFSGELQTKSHPSIFPMKTEHIDEVFKIDREIFGADRSSLLELIYHRFPQYCWISTANGSISGFIMAIEQENFLKIGPWITLPTEKSPEHLLENIDPMRTSVKVKLGILEKSQKAMEIAKKMGLDNYYHSIRMLRGDLMHHVPSEMAIGGPDRG